MKNFLVCTDGSPYSEVCCQYAAWLAQRMQATLSVTYISELGPFQASMITDLCGSLGIQPYQDVFGQMQEIEKAKVKAIEQRCKIIFKEAGLKGTPPFHNQAGTLVEYIEEVEIGSGAPDLICLGKRGENANLATEHLGASLERVIRVSIKPCLVTSRKFSPIKKLLLAYDGSPSTEKALAFFVQSHKAFKDLEFHLITVDDQNNTDVSLKRLKTAEDTLKQAGFSPITQMLTGEVEDSIARYIDEQHINFLVMGAYGHSQIRHLLIGSTTTLLLRCCRVPVLLFR